MNPTNLYMSTCRLVMQADINNQESFRELYKLLPYLRQSLTCTVCARILSSPYTPKPIETSCQHHVCKMCIGGKKWLKPSCSWCREYESYIENCQIELILKCYKKLCCYLKTSCLYEKLELCNSNVNSLLNRNTCTLELTDIIDEAIFGVCNNIPNDVQKTLAIENGAHFPNQTFGSEDLALVPSVEKYDADLKNFDSLPALPLVDCENIDKFNDFGKHEINHDVLNDSTFEDNIELCKSVSPLLTVDSSDIAPLLESEDCNGSLGQAASISPANEIYEDPVFFTETDSSTETEAVPLPASNYSIDVSSTTLTHSLSTSFEDNDNKDNLVISFNDTKLPDFGQVINSVPSISNNSRCLNKVLNNITSIETLPDLNSSGNRYGLSYNMSNMPPADTSLCQVSPSVDSIKLSSDAFSQSNKVANSVSMMPSTDLPNLSNSTSTAITCVLTMPGTILSSANVKQGFRDSFLKQAPTLNNVSSVYSVMYNDAESTKITIKRKPPDIENGNKFSMENEKLINNQQELIKKLKAKAKPKPKRKGCRCGNATPTPGKLTCCGQRCPCYVEAKACIECQCRGCRNPHRPGGKKVRPIIPQLGNIQIHQVQPVHPRVSMITPNLSNSAIHPVSISTLSSPAQVLSTTGAAPTIRAVHAMHALQTMHGIGSIHHAVQGGVHQLLNFGGNLIESTLQPAVHPELSLKPVNFALSSLSSIPTQLLMNDDKSTSNSASDNSDIDIDI